MIITIPGKPVSQGRMRVFTRGNYSGVYDPMSKQKEEIRKIIKEKCYGIPSKLIPKVSFIFHMPILKSTPKNMRNKYESGLLKHEKKPDVDNLVKLYLDCLTGFAFHDDNNVSLGFAVKLYHTNPKTIIFIDESDDLITRPELTPEAWFELFGVSTCESSKDETDSLCDLQHLEPLKLPQSGDNLNLPGNMFSSMQYFASLQDLLKEDMVFPENENFHR